VKIKLNQSNSSKQHDKEFFCTFHASVCKCDNLGHRSTSESSRRTMLQTTWPSDPSMVFHVSLALNCHLKDEPYYDSMIFHVPFLL